MFDLPAAGYSAIASSAAAIIGLVVAVTNMVQRQRDRRDEAMGQARLVHAWIWIQAQSGEAKVHPHVL